MATKTQELIASLIATLDATEISMDEKIKALGFARNHLNKSSGVSTPRYTGPVGTGKKTDELTRTMDELKPSRKKQH